MGSEPETLRLADKLDRDGYACFTDDMRAAASELRRLHVENEILQDVLNKENSEREADLAAMREALEALEMRCGTNADERQPGGVISRLKARTA